MKTFIFTHFRLLCNIFRAERLQEGADNSYHYIKILLRDFIYQTLFRWQQDDMDMLHAMWQALRCCTGQGRMNRDTGVGAAPGKGKTPYMFAKQGNGLFQEPALTSRVFGGIGEDQSISGGILGKQSLFWLGSSWRIQQWSDCSHDRKYSLLHNCESGWVQSSRFGNLATISASYLFDF